MSVEPTSAPGGDAFDGDCFTASYRLLHGLRGKPKLVHGLPQYMRPGPDFGKRFWHAWVEIQISGAWLVMDYSNGKKVVMARSAFYEHASIETVFRYTAGQADRCVMRTGHAGPWIPDWESYEHEDFRGVGLGEGARG